jgi:hypothetical protein
MPYKLSSQVTQEMFIQGNQAYNSGKYNQALVCYNKALEGGLDKNILINRGMTYLMLKDTCNACRDFKISAVDFSGVLIRFDKDLHKIFYPTCLKQSDTIYLNKSGDPCSYSDHKYYEVINHYTCEETMTGELHKKGKHLQMRSAASYTKYMTDITASYDLIDSVKYYYFIENILPGPVFSGKIEMSKGDFKKFLNKKYVFDDLPYKNQFISGKLYINSAGIAIDFESYIGPVTVLDRIDKKTFDDYILEFFRNFDRFEVPVIFNENVYFSVDCLLPV